MVFLARIAIVKRLLEVHCCILKVNTSPLCQLLQPLSSKTNGIAGTAPRVAVNGCTIQRAENGTRR